ncbi:hypothetical protein BGX38DRAFT_1281137 [Terfezia claveryi]|nr:hypothetical protein BGX38DRAFT_1281137 [Terfezia claveryi]
MWVFRGRVPNVARHRGPASERYDWSRENVEDEEKVSGDTEDGGSEAVEDENEDGEDDSEDNDEEDADLEDEEDNDDQSEDGDSEDELVTLDATREKWLLVQALKGGTPPSGGRALARTLEEGIAVDNIDGLATRHQPSRHIALVRMLEGRHRSGQHRQLRCQKPTIRTHSPGVDAWRKASRQTTYAHWRDGADL